MKVEDKDIQVFIGHVLRIGALTASLVTLVGGLIYLINHGKQSVPDLRNFKGAQTTLTSFKVIWEGLFSLDPVSIIQWGVILLIATPIMRVILSLFSFAIERDKLYVCMTLIVLCIILFNMLK